MRRRVKPAKAKVRGKLARKSPKPDDARVRDLEKRLAHAVKGKADVLAQQTATSEILRVISSAPTDLQPVFETILSRSNRLCEASLSVLWLSDGDALTAAAHTNVSPEMAQRLRTARVRPHRGGSPVALTALEQTVIHVPDVLEDPRFSPAEVPSYHLEGARSILAVPMLRGGRLVGVINTWRRESRAFSDEQIELLKTFADQALIAIENVRLFNETKEALEQQTVTSEILRTISRSPTELGPVLDAVAENAARLCEAGDIGVFQLDGDILRAGARYGTGPKQDIGSIVRIRRDLLLGRTVLERRTIHVHDMAAELETEYPGMRSTVERFGMRTMLCTPLLSGGKAVGVIVAVRYEVRPFSDKHIQLLETFADQAVIAIENVRLFNETQEALERQTATAEILRVISSSPTDVQPVFDAIARSTVRLCDAARCAVWRPDGDLFRCVARCEMTSGGDVVSLSPEGVGVLEADSLPGRVIHERQILQVNDVPDNPAVPPKYREMARVGGYRSLMAVPMVHDGLAVGVITVVRPVSAEFSDQQIRLVKTFADQAVIAIENVRLFTELQEKNRAVTEALEQQTATGEILRVISQSPTDVQPVFDAIVESATRLCDAAFAIAFRVVDGERVVPVARHNLSPDEDQAFGERWKASLGSPISRATVAGRAVLEGQVVHIADIRDDATLDMPLFQTTAGYRTVLAVPMLREGAVIGTIHVWRREVRPFSQQQIALLKTFADQAVIAAENVRLFTELQTSNRELTTALDTQTATSDILRVISRSQTDVQPVFDAIVGSAVRLLRGYSGTLTRIAGGQIELAALTSTDDAGDAALRAAFPQSLQSGSSHAQAIRDRAPLNIADAQTDPRVSEAQHAYAQARAYRSLVAVPMLRHDEAIGAIAVTRREPGGFTDDEIALLRTFADQATIAIENARLLTELQSRTEELTQSVDTLTALGEVGQAISSTLDLQTVLRTIVARATQLADADAGVIYEYDERREVFEPRATEHLEDDIVQTLVATPVRKGQGATGRLAVVREPIQVADVRAPGEQLPVRDSLIRAGYRALLAVPLVREDHLIGGLTVFRKTPGEFPADTVDLLKTFATQSSLAIQNARLFREIAQKSRELEVASQHKSEFLASMSHELRTPLNAIIGFSDVLLQGMFGETNEKQTEYLRDILASGEHLLSLINDILDLSKIEAGRMELDVAAFDLPTAIDDALLLMRERASRRGITLERHVDERPGEIRADQRKVKQVLLNLLSNAVKFTPEGGRVDVRVGLANGTAEISVTDTGIGIAPEDHDAVFEEFRQVGTADKKAEGTGLGLALAKKFVELHGGRIWVNSEVNRGSTFTFTLPMI
jgi:GAF domain-containing protein